MTWLEVVCVERLENPKIRRPSSWIATGVRLSTRVDSCAVEVCRSAEVTPLRALIVRQWSPVPLESRGNQVPSETPSPTIVDDQLVQGDPFPNLPS